MVITYTIGVLCGAGPSYSIIVCTGHVHVQYFSDRSSHRRQEHTACHVRLGNSAFYDRRSKVKETSLLTWQSVLLSQAVIMIQLGHIYTCT